MAELESFFKKGLLWLADPKSEADPRPRTVEHANCAAFGLDAIDRELPWGGLPAGALHEWSSQSSLFPCSLLALLTGNLLRAQGVNRLCGKRPLQVSEELPRHKFIVWVGRDIWPTPYLLEQTMYVTFQEGGTTKSQSLIENCLFIDPPDEKLKLWSIELALRSPAVAAVVAKRNKLSFPTSRKFALAARASGALGFLIRDARAQQESSAAFSRWSFEPLRSESSFPSFRIQLIKCKGAQPKVASWNIELREGICSYESNQQTLSLHLSTAVGNQHSAAPAQGFLPAFAHQQAR